MRWEEGRRSENIEDRRAQGPMTGGGRRRIVSGGIGTLVLALVAMYFGIDPSIVLKQLDPGLGQVQIEEPLAQDQIGRSRAQSPAADDRMGQFVSAVLADTEDVWKEIFAAQGTRYREPKLVLFRGLTQSACGAAQSATGPFYCPADQKVYIDLQFYETLRTRLGAGGDFAQAYVIAHEVGHHVQNLLGIAPRVHQVMQQVSEVEANQLSVRMELQADCFAGVWAKRADQSRRILESGDIEEAMNAAAAIGDDRLQAQSRGFARPDSFTHGTSSQRQRWFRRGFESGEVAACNTFAKGVSL